MFHKALVICLSIIAIGLTNVMADCDSLLQTPWRGLNCLYCMHKNAPRGADPIVELLTESCISNPAISFVTDGTFGWDEEIIKSATTKLQENGRSAWLHLYLYNGPAQRRWRAGVFKGFAQMEPGVFRERLKRDKKIRKLFVKEIKKILPVIQHAKSLGVKVTLAPGLEDNLDNQAFDLAIELIRRNIPQSDMPKLVRSPCSECAAGNEARFPAGVIREKHTGRGKTDVKGGIVSTDGDYFSFSFEQKSTFPKLSAWQNLLTQTGKNQSLFLLWIAKYQDSPAGVVPFSPEKRNYLEPSEDEAAEIKKFLRAETSAFKKYY